MNWATENYIKKDINELIPYDSNPREHSKEQIEQVANSIQEFGWTMPILIDEKNEIIAGHGRLMAGKFLGIKEVPCLIAKGWTEEQKKAYCIADNKLTENSKWSADFLKLNLTDLYDNDFDLNLTGFSTEELSKIIPDFAVEEGLTDENDVPEIPEDPVTKKGDVWVLGNHKIICGDATQMDIYETLLGDKKADLVVTDAPYNVDYVGKTKDKLKIQNDRQEDQSFIQFLSDSFSNLNIHLKQGGCFYIWHSDSEGYAFRTACINTDWKVRQTLIWSKNSMVLGRQDYQWQHEPCLYGWKEGGSHQWYSDRKQTTIIKHDRPTRSKLHPTMKPVGLLQYLIENSTKQEDIVLDCFLGSGSTIIACQKVNRVCYGMELDEKYCDVVIKRWQDFTGMDAILESSGAKFNDVV